jgi:hypothetical protein
MAHEIVHESEICSFGQVCCAFGQVRKKIIYPELQLGR